jgi:glyoxylase-like metal-dependent hydrolase (beta-lactamase superfamily II)
VLVHAPGETDDQVVVFLPADRVLFAADNFYEAFPNLYAIRGNATLKSRITLIELNNLSHRRNFVAVRLANLTEAERCWKL